MSLSGEKGVIPMKWLQLMFLWLAKVCGPKNIPNKAKVMAYHHDALIRRLVLKLELTQKEAINAFEGMKEFLYKCGTEKGEFPPPSEMVDEAWHNFMLFSSDYANFCFNHFGFFIHHNPIENGGGVPCTSCLGKKAAHLETCTGNCSCGHVGKLIDPMQLVR